MEFQALPLLKINLIFSECLVIVSFFRYHKKVIEDADLKARKLTDDTTENNDVMNDDSFEESLGNLPDLTRKFQIIQVIPNSVKVL